MDAYVNTIQGLEGVALMMWISALVTSFFHSFWSPTLLETARGLIFDIIILSLTLYRTMIARSEKHDMIHLVLQICCMGLVVYHLLLLFSIV